jgi:hypothetical protein
MNKSIKILIAVKKYALNKRICMFFLKNITTRTQSQKKYIIIIIQLHIENFLIHE